MESIISLNHLKNTFGDDGMLHNAIVLIFISEFLKTASENIKNYVSYYIAKFFRLFEKKKNSIQIEGWEFVFTTGYLFEYPLPMRAISFYVSRNVPISKLEYYNFNKNGSEYHDDDAEPEKFLSFKLGEMKNIQVEKNIFLDIYRSIETKEEKTHNEKYRTTYKLYSYIHPTSYLEAKLDNYVKIYNDHLYNINNGKIYHFIYQGKDQGELKFLKNVISDKENEENKNFESFETISHTHKNKIIKDIEKLRDIEYYKKHGLKRKKGYLFYGPPGCGKTSTVMAMSNMDNRHIIEVSLSRVKTNTEIEEILNMSNIGDIKFDKSQIILLFDEIDLHLKEINLSKDSSPEESSSSCDEQDNEKKKKKKNRRTDKFVKISYSDELNLPTILSRLDGIGNYSGIIIVATTNNKDNIHSAMMRSGRLEPLYFDLCTRDDIVYLSEKYYENCVPEKFIDKIPLYTNFSHAHIRTMMESYENISDFFEKITYNEQEYLENILKEALKDV